MSVSRNNELLRAIQSYSTKMLFYFVSIALGSLQSAGAAFLRVARRQKARLRQRLHPAQQKRLLCPCGILGQG